MNELGAKEQGQESATEFLKNQENPKVNVNRGKRVNLDIMFATDVVLVVIWEGIRSALQKI